MHSRMFLIPLKTENIFFFCIYFIILLLQTIYEWVVAFINAVTNKNMKFFSAMCHTLFILIYQLIPYQFFFFFLVAMTETLIIYNTSTDFISYQYESI